MAPPTRLPPKSQDQHRINEYIRAQSVRVVDEDGQMLGVLSRDEAIRTARDRGMDLVEISPNAEPPVCKIIDYGKFKYEAQKKARLAKKNQKVVEIKELKLRPTIGENDYQVKLRAAVKFIEEGDKVKFTIRFRGREITHQDVALKVMNRVVEDMKEVAKAEITPRMEGRQMVMMLVPLKV